MSLINLPMRLKSDLIVFDLEANQPSGRIIEIGAVRLSRTFELQDTFQRFVNPDETISQEILTLCSLDMFDVGQIIASPHLVDVNKAFYAWATQTTKNVTLASWGNYDVAELHLQDPTCQFRKKAIEIKSIVTWEAAKLHLTGADSLEQRCKDFGVNVVSPKHRALPDAMTTALLLQAVYTRHENNKSKLLSVLQNQL